MATLANLLIAHLLVFRVLISQFVMETWQQQKSAVRLTKECKWASVLVVWYQQVNTLQPSDWNVKMHCLSPRQNAVLQLHWFFLCASGNRIRGSLLYTQFIFITVYMTWVVKEPLLLTSGNRSVLEAVAQGLSECGRPSSNNDLYQHGEWFF